MQGVDPPRLDLALALAYDLLENLSKLLRDNREELGTLLRSAANMIRQMDAAIASKLKPGVWKGNPRALR